MYTICTLFQNRLNSVFRVCVCVSVEYIEGNLKPNHLEHKIIRQFSNIIIIITIIFSYQNFVEFIRTRTPIYINIHKFL